jgi:immunity protein 49 of polymorphic toxin system
VALAEAGEGIAWKVAVWLRAYFDAEVPLRQMGDVSIDLCNDLRALAIIGLLAFGDTKLFRRNLVQSARVRCFYLERLKEAGLEDDHHQASGRVEPLLDAIAAGDLELGRRIVALSPTQLLRGREYEDDYCFAQLIHGLLVQRNDGRLDGLLQQFESYLEGKGDARLDVCRALVLRDHDDFDTAFESLLSAREQHIAEAKKRQLDEDVVVALRHVYVDGLAALALAEMHGIKTQDEYRFCPSLARRL